MLALVLAALIAGSVAEAPAPASERPEREARARGDPEKAARIAAFWSRFFAAPTDHRYTAGVSLGPQGWERAYGGYSTAWLARLRLRRSLAGIVPAGEWLGIAVQADYSSIEQHTSALRVVNRQYVVGTELGLFRWLGRFRINAGLEVGAAFQTSRLSDDVGAEHAGFRTQFGIGGMAGAGVSVAGKAYTGLSLGARRQGGRLHFLLLLDVEWLVGATASNT